MVSRSSFFEKIVLIRAGSSCAVNARLIKRPQARASRMRKRHRRVISLSYGTGERKAYHLWQ